MGARHACVGVSVTALLLIDFTVTPPAVKRIVDTPWMGRRWKVTNLAELHSVFPGVEHQLEMFRTNPDAFNVWTDPDAA